jgi:hypothetical protein
VLVSDRGSVTQGIRCVGAVSLTEEFRVAKNEVAAEVTLAGRAPEVLRLFLAAQARGHAGDERPSDLLNGTDLFIPAIDRRGTLHLVRRDAVVVVTVPAEYELRTDGAAPDGAPVPASQRAMVEVLLDNGTAIGGAVEYVMPEARSRLLDFLNLEDRFLVLRQAGTVHIVNKRHIVRVDAR